MADAVAQSWSWLGGLRTFAFGRRPAWTLIRIAVFLVVTFILLKYVILIRRIESTSMAPTLREGTIHIINRLAYSPARPPDRGDIVGVRTSGVTIMYVKRIIGLPGETVAIHRGVVLIDGQPLDEPYVVRRRRDWTRPPRPLGPDEYYVIGDNRFMDIWQHDFGAIEARRIVGKVVW